MATEPDGPPRYRVDYAADGPHGHAVGLVEAHAPAGTVLDLGCGYAAVGDVLLAGGRRYVGCDRDTTALADLAARGLDGHVVDLAACDGLAGRLADLLPEGPTGAILMLDVVEHLPDVTSVLAEVAALCARCEDDGGTPPLLVVSIPNVAHFDLAAKLLGGRWDVTETGLLDRTHLQLFTEQRLMSELSLQGWREVARDDVVLERSDQWFPQDHPFLVDGGVEHDHLRALRSQVDPNGAVNQFVRAYRLSTAAVAPGPDEIGSAAGGEPFLSVLVTTDGERAGDLVELWSCLSAQRADDFEVVVAVCSAAPFAAETVRAQLAETSPGLAGRTRVEGVATPSRTVARNTALGLAGGRYVAFVDEDDRVSPDWVEAFADGACRRPGRVVRSVAVSRAAPAMPSPGAFDAVAHLAADLTPLPSAAVPRSLVAETGLRFADDAGPASSERAFVLRAALLVGVEDTGQSTCVTGRWPRARPATSGPMRHPSSASTPRPCCSRRGARRGWRTSWPMRARGTSSSTRGRGCPSSRPSPRRSEVRSTGAPVGPTRPSAPSRRCATRSSGGRPRRFAPSSTGCEAGGSGGDDTSGAPPSRWARRVDPSRHIWQPSSMQPDELDGKVALITGGGNGIGAAVAARLAGHGTKVVLADVDAAGGEAVAAELGADFVHCDVRQLDQVEAAVAFAVSRHGGLDIAHLNAGVTTGCGLGEDFDLELYRRAMAVNLDGVAFGFHAVLPALKARGGGHIVTTASMAGIVAPPLDPVYVANKHTVVGMTRSMAAEYAAQDVTINALCPSFAATGIIEAIRPWLEETRFPILEIDDVVDTFMAILESGRTGECWYVVPGRTGEPFNFRNTPGPR